jgi:hypothetical protein
MHQAPEATVPKHALLQRLLDEDHPSFLLEAQVAILEDRGEISPLPMADVSAGVVSGSAML